MPSPARPRSDDDDDRRLQRGTRSGSSSRERVATTMTPETTDGRSSARLQELEEMVAKCLRQSSPETQTAAMLPKFVSASEWASFRDDMASQLASLEQRLAALEIERADQVDHGTDVEAWFVPDEGSDRIRSQWSSRMDCPDVVIHGIANLPPYTESLAAVGQDELQNKEKQEQAVAEQPSHDGELDKRGGEDTGIPSRRLGPAFLAGLAEQADCGVDESVRSSGLGSPSDAAYSNHEFATSRVDALSAVEKHQTRGSNASSAKVGKGKMSASVQWDTLTMTSRSSAKYHLKESVWDVSLLLGYSRMGMWVNVMLAFSLILNITMQVSLCAIVATELSFDPYDDDFTSGLQAWRRNVSEIVANQICAEDYALSTHTLQAQTLAETRDFTSPGLLQSLETGPLLASIVIFMWTLSVSEVFHTAIDFLMAVRQLGRQHASRSFSICQMIDSDIFLIEGVTTWRICWATFVGILQLGIAFCLLLSGALWLAYTKSIPDLLANAVALSYVMQVDEMLYQVFVPRKVKALVQNLEPINMSRSVAGSLPQGIPKKALLSAFFAFVFFGAVVGSCVIPHASKMRQLRDEICPQ